MKWGPAEDAKLFLAAIKAHDLKLNVNAMAVEMNKMGEDCTPKAITHRIAKLKAEAAANTASGSEFTPATPAKRKRGPNKDASASSSNKKTASLSKSAKFKMGIDSDDDEELAGGSPTPRPAKKGQANEANIKSEEDVEEELQTQIRGEMF